MQHHRALIVALIVVALLATGCGSSPTPGGQAVTPIVDTEPPPTAAVPATEAPTTMPEQPAGPTTAPVTAEANAQIIDEGALRATPRLTGDRIGTVCPGDAVAILERGTIWHRVQVVTVGADCDGQHAQPGAEGWVAFQNVQLPTRTPEPAAAEPTEAPPAEPTSARAPTAPAAPEDRYLAVAQRAAIPNVRASGGLDAGEWKAEAADFGSGVELVLTMPLNQALSNDQFVRLGKQSITQVVNALFVDDPNLAVVSLIGTFPNSEGQELPAISLFVRRSASANWGGVRVGELETIAERFEVKPQFQ